MSWELNNFQSYVDFTDTTAEYPGAGQATRLARYYALLGLTGEAGELANRMKKLIRGDYGEGATLGRESWRELMLGELGGFFWYVARQVREWQMPASAVQEIWDKFEDAQPWDVKDLESAAEAVIALTTLAGNYVDTCERIEFEIAVHTAFEIAYGLGFDGNAIFAANIVKLISRQERNLIKGDGDER